MVLFELQNFFEHFTERISFLQEGMLTNLMAYYYGIILSRLVYQTDDKEVHNNGIKLILKSHFNDLYFF